MAKLITVTELKKSLKQLDQEKLINIILELSKANKFSHEILTAKFSTNLDLSTVKEEYETKIYKTFFPRTGSVSTNVKEAKALLNQFLKLSKNKELSIDLMVFYLETCAELFDFGVESSSLFNTVFDVFQHVVIYINTENNNQLFIKYKDRLNSIINSVLSINWELSDELTVLYYQIDGSELDDEDNEDEEFEL